MNTRPTPSSPIKNCKEELTMTVGRKALVDRMLLKRLYVDLGKSDNEIANLLGLERATITNARKRFGIKARLSVGRKGEMVALQKLEKLGFRALDMNKINKLSEFDILVDDNLKIEVKSASEHKGKFKYVLSENQKMDLLFQISVSACQTEGLESCIQRLAISYYL